MKNRGFELSLNMIVILLMGLITAMIVITYVSAHGRGGWQQIFEFEREAVTGTEDVVCSLDLHTIGCENNAACERACGTDNCKKVGQRYFCPDT